MAAARVTLEEVLQRAAPATVPEVIDTMRAIDAALPQADGVAWFNKLYLSVTEAVQDSLADATFGEPPFLARLDIVFANLYFDALRTSIARPPRTPRAWVPLIDSRARRDLAPIQFATAGMNAHINRDLPLALVDTWQALGFEPALDGAEHADFVRVNALLVETEARVKSWFSTGFTGVVDRTFGNLDDTLALWNVARARDAAWTNAQTLWALRDQRELSEAFLLTLDRMVGFASRGLLLPVEPPARGPARILAGLRRLWRRLRSPS